MMRCGQMGADAIDRLKASQKELNKVLMEIVHPDTLDLNDLPNPYDEKLEEPEHE